MIQAGDAAMGLEFMNDAVNDNLHWPALATSAGLLSALWLYTATHALGC
jgi:hypothetical protein